MYDDEGNEFDDEEEDQVLLFDNTDYGFWDSHPDDNRSLREDRFTIKENWEDDSRE